MLGFFSLTGSCAFSLIDFRFLEMTTGHDICVPGVGTLLDGAVTWATSGMGTAFGMVEISGRVLCNVAWFRRLGSSGVEMEWSKSAMTRLLVLPSSLSRFAASELEEATVD